MINNDYQNLSNFLSDQSIYEKDFYSAQAVELYDYQGLLVWKTFIHYCYEKIQQVRIIVGEEEFRESFWNSGGTSDKKKYQLEKFDNSILYCYSDLEDATIIQLVARIFKLEKNYIDLLNNMKKKRDFSAHVVMRSLFGLKDVDIADMLDKIIQICTIINEKYKNEYLLDAGDDILSSVNLSASEVNFYINNKIQALSNSKSFDDSQKLMKILERNLDKLSSRSIDSILSSIQNGQIVYGYNQALDLSYSSSFLLNLLSQSKKIGSNLISWKSFYEGLSESDQERFVDIKRSLKNSGVEFDFNNLKYLEPGDMVIDF